MRALYVRAMDAAYHACVIIAGIALCLISAVIPWAVFTRYVLNSAASWPESAAVLLTIWLTFFGAAGCYRMRQHMNVGYFVSLMPPFWQRFCNGLAEAAMMVMAVFMSFYGARLVIATWHNSIAEFPELSTGVTYLPIPLGGVLLALFIIERALCGPPPAPAGLH